MHGRGASAIGVVDNKEGVDESLEGKRKLVQSKGEEWAIKNTSHWRRT